MANTNSMHVRRALRRHGFNFTVEEFYDLVLSGHSEERTELTRQLVEASESEAITSLLVAAYSGYVEGFIRDTSFSNARRDGVRYYDLWSLGIEKLIASIQSARRCTGSDLHLIKSTKRDFLRGVNRLREHPEMVLVPEVEWSISEGHVDEWTSAAVEELVSWLTTEFAAEEATARMVVATRVGGFPLGDKNNAALRARNCRDRKRLEDKVRGSVCPTEGLAAAVLSRAA